MYVIIIITYKVIIIITILLIEIRFIENIILIFFIIHLYIYISYINNSLQEIFEKRRRRRESHNAVERRRRDNINERIQGIYLYIYI